MRDTSDGPDTVEDVHLGEMADSLGFLLRLSQLWAFRDFFERLGPLGLRPGEMSVLILIRENPGVRQGILARRLIIKRAHMTKMIRALEEKGLVRRTVPDDDRRSVELWLTEEGQRHVEKLQEPIREHEENSRGRLTRAEAAQLKRLLRKYSGVPVAGK